MRNPFYFYLYFWLLLSAAFCSCKKDHGCGHSQEVDHIDGVNYGYIPFNDSTAYWLPTTPDSVLTFKSSNGFTGVFNLSVQDTNSVRTIIHSKNKDSSECWVVKIDDYGFPQHLRLAYEPVKDIFQIIIDKHKKINPSVNSAQGHNDIIFIRIANWQFEFGTGADFDQAFKLEYYPQIQLNGSTFTSVYKVTNNVYSNVTGKIVLTEVYFKPGEGVVGFKFSNEEVWSKQ